MCVGSQHHSPAVLPPWKDLFIEGWVDPSAGLEGCGKSRPHQPVASRYTDWANSAIHNRHNISSTVSDQINTIIKSSLLSAMGFPYGALWKK